MAANDKIVRSSPPQNKAAASAKVLPPMNQSSIELNDNEDEEGAVILTRVLLVKRQILKETAIWQKQSGE